MTLPQHAFPAFQLLLRSILLLPASEGFLLQEKVTPFFSAKARTPWPVAGTVNDIVNQTYAWLVVIEITIYGDRDRLFAFYDNRHISKAKRSTEVCVLL